MPKPQYGYQHQKERARWKPIVEAGGVNCARCGNPIIPGTKWHLDHNDNGEGYRGASHATCNVATSKIHKERADALQRQLDGEKVWKWFD